MKRLGLLLWFCVFATGQLLTGGSVAAADGVAPKLIAATDAGPVYLQPLDAPGNPYAGQYSELDAWVYANATLMSDEEFQAQYGPGPEARALAATRSPDWRVQIGYADSSGFLMPMREQTRRRQMPFEWKAPVDWINFRARPEDYEKVFVGLHKFYAVGSFSPELGQLEKEAWSTPDASAYPPVPAWLGEMPPQETIFVPNGEILCVGPLGLRYSEEPQEPYFERTEGLLTYRYSPDGKLLGTYDLRSVDGAEWMLIYWPQMHEVLESYSAQSRSRHIGHGTIAVVKQDLAAMMPGAAQPGADEKREILACFDYDGTVLDPNKPLTRDFRRYGSTINAESLALVYRAQLAAGLTGADSISPFAGTAQGPVLTDPAPRPRPLIAGDRFSARSRSLAEVTVTDGRSKRWVVVQPLLDPANPWRDSYGPWDTWLLEQRDAQNLRLRAAFEKQRQQQAELRAKLTAEGREPSAEEQKFLSGSGLRMDLADPWQRYELQVDANGYVVPYAQSSIAKLREVAGKDQRGVWSRQGESEEFLISSGGEMPVDLQAQLYEAQQDQLAKEGLTLPRIPGWLMNQPVERAAIAPNGDVITYGPLGSFNPDPALEYTSQRRLANFDEQYHRYSPEGTHIAAIPAGAAPPCALFNLGLLTRFADLDSSGMLWTSEAGITIVADKQTREATEAYDWDGSPLPVDQPLYGYPVAMHWWYYNELARLFEAQGPD